MYYLLGPVAFVIKGIEHMFDMVKEDLLPTFLDPWTKETEDNFEVNSFKHYYLRASRKERRIHRVSTCVQMCDHYIPWRLRRSLAIADKLDGFGPLGHWRVLATSEPVFKKTSKVCVEDYDLI